MHQNLQADIMCGAVVTIIYFQIILNLLKLFATIRFKSCTYIHIFITMYIFYDKSNLSFIGERVPVAFRFQGWDFWKAGKTFERLV